MSAPALSGWWNEGEFKIPSLQVPAFFYIFPKESIWREARTMRAILRATYQGGGQTSHRCQTTALRLHSWKREPSGPQKHYSLSWFCPNHPNPKAGTAPIA